MLKLKLLINCKFRKGENLMEIQLQELIEQIKKDGVEAAESQAEAILTAAKDEAQKIISDAKAEAEKIVADAKAEADRKAAEEKAYREKNREKYIAYNKKYYRENPVCDNPPWNNTYIWGHEHRHL